MKSARSRTAQGKTRSFNQSRVLLTGGSGFIGTNLADLLLACGASVVNADVRPPLSSRHKNLWCRCDVGSEVELRAVVAATDPHFVIHLAARTDTASDVVNDYAINSLGTANAVRTLDAAPAVERFVFVSSQFVLGPDSEYRSETEYSPHTAYGRSKADAECLLRRRPPATAWTIVRPTNVWGPWHLRYQREFWKVVRRGMYVHPSTPDPVRSYGYVGSVCLQILAVLQGDGADVDGRALYVGDEPIRLSEWVDAFSVALRGRPARRIPGVAIAAVAKAGELARRVGVPTPLDASRYRSMTQDYPTPMQLTADALGGLPCVPLSVGVDQTVAWLDHGRSPDVRTWLGCGGLRNSGSD